MPRTIDLDTAVDVTLALLASGPGLWTRGGVEQAMGDAVRGAEGLLARGFRPEIDAALAAGEVAGTIGPQHIDGTVKGDHPGLRSAYDLRDVPADDYSYVRETSGIGETAAQKTRRLRIEAEGLAAEEQKRQREINEAMAAVGIALPTDTVTQQLINFDTAVERTHRLGAARRKCALELAIEYLRHSPDTRADVVLVAGRFERYLAGPVPGQKDAAVEEDK